MTEGLPILVWQSVGDSDILFGLVSVSPSQKIKLYIDDPTHIETHSYTEIL